MPKQPEAAVEHDQSPQEMIDQQHNIIRQQSAQVRALKDSLMKALDESLSLKTELALADDEIMLLEKEVVGYKEVLGLEDSEGEDADSKDA